MVYLCPLEVPDAAELAAFTAGETESFHLGHGRMPLGAPALAAWIRDIAARQPPETVELAARRVADDRLLGYVGVWELDWVNATGEIDIALWPAATRGRGYGSETLRLLLGLAFGPWQLRALRALVWSMNGRSAAALGRVGFRPAGRLRSTVVTDGFPRDQLVFDLTADEWVSTAAANAAAPGRR